MGSLVTIHTLFLLLLLTERAPLDVVLAAQNAREDPLELQARHRATIVDAIAVLLSQGCEDALKGFDRLHVRFEVQVELSPIAARVVLKALYVARIGRMDFM